jgi:hypothetical protein
MYTFFLYCKITAKYHSSKMAIGFLRKGPPGMEILPVNGIFYGVYGCRFIKSCIIL